MFSPQLRGRYKWGIVLLASTRPHPRDSAEWPTGPSVELFENDRDVYGVTCSYATEGAARHG